MGRIAAVILAAGYSKRLGSDKLRQDLCGRNVLQRCIDQILEAGFGEVYVVIREQEQASYIEQDGRITLVRNTESTTGMASSIRTAINAMKSTYEAALIVNGDMPFFGSINYRKLLELWEETEGGISSAYCMGEIRSPAIFSRTYFSELTQIEGDAGAKRIVQKHSPQARFLEISNPDYLFDIDTIEDLEYARSMCNFFS